MAISMPELQRSEPSIFWIAWVYPAWKTGNRGSYLAGNNSVARALAHEPQIVVADEPTGNLDLATGDAILDLLLDINHQTGTTFIISTHSTQLTERARRVVEIRDGELAYDSYE